MLAANNAAANRVLSGIILIEGLSQKGLRKNIGPILKRREQNLLSLQNAGTIIIKKRLVQIVKNNGLKIWTVIEL